jgi:hypothetical protein
VWCVVCGVLFRYINFIYIQTESTNVITLGLKLIIMIFLFSLVVLAAIAAGDSAHGLNQTDSKQLTGASSNRCGSDWANANGKCGTFCNGYDSDCSGEK